MLHVIAYTGGRDVPASRFRVRQYVPALRAFGIEVDERPSRFGAYPPRTRAARPFWAAGNLAAGFVGALASKRYDVTLLQREFLSRFVTSEPLTKAPRVLDVDDAIWLFLGERRARRLASLADLVLCGNAFLAEWFARDHPHVAIFPTGVDTERFRPAASPPANGLVLGWSGSSIGNSYLESIEEPLSRLLGRHRDARLRVVSDVAPRFRSLSADRVEFLRWSPDVEVEAIQGMTVGLMPLDDSTLSRGKCSLKILLYLACGVPVVASPVGTNVDLLGSGLVGMAATSGVEWESAIEYLFSDSARRESMGRAGRDLVATRFSIAALAPKLAAFLLGAVERG